MLMVSVLNGTFCWYFCSKLPVFSVGSLTKAALGGSVFWAYGVGGFRVSFFFFDRSSNRSSGQARPFYYIVYTTHF